MRKLSKFLKVPKFYIVCSLGNILFFFCVIFLTTDFLEPKVMHDNMFVFRIVTWGILVLYAPLCTILGYLFYITKINKHIINHPLLYSLFPLLITYPFNFVFKLNGALFDYMLIGLFVAENIAILIWGYIKHVHQTNQ